VDASDVAALLERCVKGDDSARAEFIAVYDDIVRGAVKFKLRLAAPSSEFASDSDDITNEVYLRLFRNNCEALARIRNPGSLDAWLMTIAQNQVYSYLRKHRSGAIMKEAVVRETRVSQTRSPDDQLIREEDASLLLRTLERLESKDRLILQMYYLDDRSYADIAHTLGLNINTVASRLMRAKAKLRKEFAGGDA